MADDGIGQRALPGSSAVATRVRVPLDSPEQVRVIEEVIAELRPGFQADGGDCQLVAVEPDRVLVRMTGACVGCQLAGATLQGLQGRLMARLNRLVRVIPVPAGG
jgi:NifU-like protein